MPSSALNAAPTLADIQRRQSDHPAPSSSSTPQHPAFGNSALRRRRPSSHSSHGSDSSHSSHSSYARRHPDRVPQKAASPNGAFGSVLALLGLMLVYTLVGLWLFVKGFLLTRHELVGTNECARPTDRDWNLPMPPERLDDDAALLNWADTVLHPTVGMGECRLAPTHTKAVVLIIDALRYDFIAPPPPPSTNGELEINWTANPFYHNILSLPSSLTAQSDISTGAPASFLAHFAADPPTTTLQRLKGLTTGTLPTFVEAGANFGSAGTGVGRVNEDNWIAQFRRSILSSSSSADGERAGLVFAGDDTWSTVFPGLFDEDTNWTYDSFNVEDLDTVDRGVESKLLPFLQVDHPERKAGVHDHWRLLVGHTLGVDHVGHRFGASHPKMKTKLQEMQTFLRNVTDAVDEDTLVILMGDHGMDERGDHGGDAELEVGAGIWMYSKRGFGRVGRDAALRMDPAEYISTAEVETMLPSRIPFSPLPSPPYPEENHRSIPQIDLVPTLSILLGLPIPYNNLGSIIPDLFPHPHLLLRALRITATQMRTYLKTYANHSPDLAAFSPEFQASWLAAIRADAHLASLLHHNGGGGGGRKSQEEVEEAWRRAAQAYHRFNRLSLVRAREVWAQFDMVRIWLGLLVLVLGLAVGWVIRYGAQEGLVGRLRVDQQEREETKEEVRKSRTTTELYTIVSQAIVRPALIGGIAGLGLHFSTALLAVKSLSLNLTLLDSVLAGASISSSLSLVISHLAQTLSFGKPTTEDDDDDAPATTNFLNVFGWVIVVLHAALFASNSFLVFEDRFVLLCLATLSLIRGLLLIGSSPDTRTKIRAGFLAFLSLVLVRLGSIPRVCREEQLPYCTSTFFSSSSSSDSSSSFSTTTGENGGSSAALNSPYVMVASYLFAYILPSILAQFLRDSKSNVGVAPVFFKWILRPTLMLGSGYWILDYVSPLESVARSGWSQTLEWVKGWVAKTDLVILVGLAMTFWIFAPLCLEIRRETNSEEEGERKEKVTILGYANSLGSSYLLLVSIVVSVLWLCTQPSGQLGMGVGVVAGLVGVEMGDAERDVVVLHRQRKVVHALQNKASIEENGKRQNKKKSTTAPSPSPSQPQSEEALQQRTRKVIHHSSTEIAFLVLIGYMLFFSTGHQATLSTIQWRIAFLTDPILSYPLSPLLVGINTFGHVSVVAPLLVSLSVLWNATPRPRGSGRRMSTSKQLLCAMMTVGLYNGMVLVSTVGLGGVVFRRHLMLFKVWTPRFMLAAVVDVMGQIGGLMAGLAVWLIGGKVNQIFGCEFD
ncbi:related to GPI13 - protein involved in glycosylphosphatidylinositol biosynthesis [Ustilago trichophora]|uniref:Related to GPI13 - protein involved in glycosylphosphatidylinositol biosynthesis n=1 Tax=Ustilago trichophora TaxID=86804 RepID=A0A5C3EC48_9BASI|nr:related to GPI13 - protein involved in glycosylphosphatidylinositol biosynthesis [Ustilago trichophora]